jgi:hypothetical protein
MEFFFIGPDLLGRPLHKWIKVFSSSGSLPFASHPDFEKTQIPPPFDAFIKYSHLNNGNKDI